MGVNRPTCRGRSGDHCSSRRDTLCDGLCQDWEGHVTYTRRPFREYWSVLHTLETMIQLSRFQYMSRQGSDGRIQGTLHGYRYDFQILYDECDKNYELELVSRKPDLHEVPDDEITV